MDELPYVTRFLEPFDESLLWIVIVAFVVSFFLAFGLGANDAANSFGTVVGAKVFTLLQAIVLAAIFETLGAIALGGNVSGTIRGGLFNPSVYDGHEELLMVGQLSALTSACTWLLIATIMSLPVSGSHSIVGASVGFHLVVFLGMGVDWFVIGKIVISWVASPILSGIVSSLIYFVLKYTMLDRDEQLKWGLRTVPFWYFIVFFINCISILLGIEQVTTATSLGVWLVVFIALGVGLFVSLAALVFLVPYTRRKAIAAEERHRQEHAEEQRAKAKAGEIELNEVNHVHENKGATTDEEELNDIDTVPPTCEVRGQRLDSRVSRLSFIIEQAEGIQNDGFEPSTCEVRGQRLDSRVSRLSTAIAKAAHAPDKKSEHWLSVKDTVTVTAICGPLQGLSACFAAFSHGGNDVSNAIGPLIGLYLIYEEGRIITDNPTPIWILIFGGAGITVGLAALGWRVIKTVGTNLTPMTSSTGFAINLGAATTVLVASNLSIPVSTTHCLVGSVAFVGFIRARQAMDWRLFGGIFSAWIITLPATVLLSAAFMGLIQHAVPGGCDIQQMQYPGPNSTVFNSTVAEAFIS